MDSVTVASEISFKMAKRKSSDSTVCASKKKRFRWAPNFIRLSQCYVQIVFLHYKNKIVKITNLLVSTVQGIMEIVI